MHAIPPHGLRLRADQTYTVEARLENWGRTPARTARKAIPRGLMVTRFPVVPAAHDGAPGTATLPIRIVPRELAPGTYTLSAGLLIEGGEPSEIGVPVIIDVTPAEQRARPWRAALLALLLLTLVLYVVRGLP